MSFFNNHISARLFFLQPNTCFIFFKEYFIFENKGYMIHKHAIEIYNRLFFVAIFMASAFEVTCSFW